MLQCFRIYGRVLGLRSDSAALELGRAWHASVRDHVDTDVTGSTRLRDAC